MKTLLPILFYCEDAPALSLSPLTVAATLTTHLAHVQGRYLDRIGQTYSLQPALFWRGRLAESAYIASGAQYSVFKELNTDGVIDVADTETMMFVVLWGPVDDVPGLGYCDSRWWSTRQPYAGRMVAAPSCIRDMLSLPKTGTPANKYASWSLQMKGYLEHEIAHHRIGENQEWWNYPDSKFTPEQLTTLKGSPWLWVR